MQPSSKSKVPPKKWQSKSGDVAGDEQRKFVRRLGAHEVKAVVDSASNRSNTVAGHPRLGDLDYALSAVRARVLAIGGADMDAALRTEVDEIIKAHTMALLQSRKSKIKDEVAA